MDKERKKRKQLFWLIVRETLMVLAIVILSVILVFAAMGWRVDDEGLGQSGLAQINSRPTGASVEIDGEVMFARTNMARMLTAGEHNIKVYREGYDNWEKTVVVRSGEVLRLDYPRLFALEREPETVRKFTGLALFSVTADRNHILYAEKGSRKWQYMDIRGEEIAARTLDVSEVVEEGYKVSQILWSGNGERALIRLSYSDRTEWVLLNVRNVANSLNLTQEFNMDFSEVKIANDSAERLVALENGNVRTLSVADKAASSVLISDVLAFNNDEMAIAYVTSADAGNKSGADSEAGVGSSAGGGSSSGAGKKIMLYQDSGDDVLIYKAPADAAVKVALSEYLEQKYLSFTIDKKLYVYKAAAYPAAENVADGDAALLSMKLVAESEDDKFTAELGFLPAELSARRGGEFVVARSKTAMAVFDAEIDKVSAYELESDELIWVDEFLASTVSDGKLIVRDFDGQNRREITAVAAGYDATITANGKWLYYVFATDAGVEIRREKITI